MLTPDQAAPLTRDQQQHLVFYLYALEQLQLHAVPRCACTLGTILVMEHAYPIDQWLYDLFAAAPQLLPSDWHLLRPPGTAHGGKG